MRPETRARVRSVIEALGYEPDGAALAGAPRLRQVIGFVAVERIAHQSELERSNLLFQDEVLRSVQSCLRRIGWSVLVAVFAVGDGDRCRRLQALSARVDGLVIGEGVLTTAALERLAEWLPIVVFAGSREERAFDVVTVDNRSGSAALSAHLINVHRRRRFFLVDGPPDAPDALERRLALERVVRAHRGTRLLGSYQGNFSLESGDAAGKDILAGFGTALPDAVVCVNDQSALGVIRTLSGAGVRVPESVSVVGFDDVYLGRFAEPPLTTVHQPVHHLGERACSLLLDRIARRDLEPRTEVLPTDLVVRSSCGCPPGTSLRRPVSPISVTRPAAAYRVGFERVARVS